MSSFERDRQSFSSLSSYALCGEKYRMQYIECVPSFFSPRSAAGYSFHQAIEKYFSSILETGEVLPLENLKKIVTESLKELENERSLKPGSEEDARKLLSEVYICLEKLYETHLQSIRPLVVEAEIEGTLGNVNIRGRIDIIGKLEENVEIFDFKLRSRMSQSIDATQMLIYTHLARNFSEINPLFPRPERGRYIVCVSKKAGVDIAEYIVEIPERLDGVITEVEERVAAIKAGVFPPATADAWICSPDYCDYYGICRFTLAGARKANRR